jgi:hypothetical protein
VAHITFTALLLSRRFTQKDLFGSVFTSKIWNRENMDFIFIVEEMRAVGPRVCVSTTILQTRIMAM